LGASMFFESSKGIRLGHIRKKVVVASPASFSERPAHSITPFSTARGSLGTEHTTCNVW
jgi:hypothetical protein